MKLKFYITLNKKYDTSDMRFLEIT